MNALFADLKTRGVILPLCPVHEKLMSEDSAALTPPFGTGPICHCHVDGCTLYWSRQHEHFDLRNGSPAYTNSTSDTQMRCPNAGHGCLYLAEIDAAKNLWKWSCAVCNFSYTDAPGAWANPPTQL